LACVAVEIPGTGDCPALSADPESADRLFSSILDWIHQQSWANKKKIIAWGFSTGAYYSLRLAHTHREQFTAAIAQGAGCHYMFDPKWIDMTSHLEYAF
jgi:predicted esterase